MIFLVCRSSSTMKTIKTQKKMKRFYEKLVETVLRVLDREQKTLDMFLDKKNPT